MTAPRTCGAADGIDRIERYAPETVMTVRGGMRPVLRWIAHPPGERAGCPIAPEWTALECVTDAGSRWYGCERAWIGSDLRMHVVGFPERDEVRRKWAIVPEADRD